MKTLSLKRIGMLAGISCLSGAAGVFALYMQAIQQPEYRSIKNGQRAGDFLINQVRMLEKQKRAPIKGQIDTNYRFSMG